MHEPSIRVMNMVRRALLETPDVTDRALYMAAVALDATIGELSLKQFQSRYPRRVRRLEIGSPRHRSNERSEPPTKPSITERPHVYAPGEDTLRRAPASPFGQSVPHPKPWRREDEGGTPRTNRRVPPHVDGEGGRFAGAASSDEAVEQNLPESRSASDHHLELNVAEADAAGSPSSSSPAQPWPLVLRPAAADRAAEPRLRLLEKSSAGHRRARGNVQPAGPSLSGAPNQPASQASEPNRAAPSKATPRKTEPVNVGQEALASKRAEIRRVLLAWARDIAAAESRGSLVAVLARANEFVDVIVDRYLMASAHGLSAGDSNESPPQSSDGRSGAASSGPPDIRHAGRIDAYDPAELDAIVRWVARVGQWRDQEELVERVFGALNFKRRGRRILATIRAAVDRVLERSGTSGRSGEGISPRSSPASGVSSGTAAS
jgi:hypothetical protein